MRLALLGGTELHASAEHLEAAGQLGRLLAEHHVTLLDDGPCAGSRAALAEAFSRAGGITIGSLDHSHADLFLVLPGGSDRLEQLFELGLAPPPDSRPCGLLNTGNYFTRLLGGEVDAVVERFAQETQRGRLVVDRDPQELLQAMLDFRPPETRRQAP